METVVSVFVLKILKSMDRDTFFVFYRISITCKNNTNCCIVLKFKDGEIVTNGGRVLGITAKGETLKEARKNAYAATEWISFANKYMRHDIGKAIDEA